MHIVDHRSEHLRTPCVPFDFSSPATDPVELAESLVRKMYEHNGIGLAANQVGLNVRVFALRGAPQNFVCFNPRVVDTSSETVVLEEGCLSFPGLYVKVKRPKSIRVRFQTPNSETRTEVFTGLTARAFLHEMDHLDGVLFYNRANRYHREKALSKFRG